METTNECRPIPGYPGYKATIGRIARDETWACPDEPQGVLPHFEGEINGQRSI